MNRFRVFLVSMGITIHMYLDYWLILRSSTVSRDPTQPSIALVSEVGTNSEPKEVGLSSDSSFPVSGCDIQHVRVLNPTNTLKDERSTSAHTAISGIPVCPSKGLATVTGETSFLREAGTTREGSFQRDSVATKKPLEIPQGLREQNDKGNPVSPHRYILVENCTESVQISSNDNTSAPDRGVYGQFQRVGELIG